MPVHKSKQKAKLARLLREGRVVEWNELRYERGPEFRPNLEHMNLRGADMPGVDLRQAVLRSTNFTGANLTGADLRKAIVTFANFNQARLTDADLRGAKNLTKAQLESAADARGVKYDESKFTEPNLPGAVPAVFLSYSWEDKAAVLAVDQWLRDHGARVILDERNFVAGESIREEIIRWITAAGVVVCFVSHSSRDRHYFQLEREIAEHSRGQGKRLIYFNLDDTILDVVHQSRLYVPGHQISFEEACSRLWQGILRTTQPAKAVDLQSMHDAGTEWTTVGRKSFASEDDN